MKTPKTIVIEIFCSVALKGGQLDENGLHIAIIRKLRIDASCVEIANCALDLLLARLDTANLTVPRPWLQQFHGLRSPLGNGKEHAVDSRITVRLSSGDPSEAGYVVDDEQSAGHEAQDSRRAAQVERNIHANIFGKRWYISARPRIEPVVFRNAV